MAYKHKTAAGEMRMIQRKLKQMRDARRATTKGTK